MTLNSLKSKEHFVCWKHELEKSGRVTKVPYSPIDCRRVGTTEDYHSRWGTYEQAKSALEVRDNGFSGTGFVFVRVTEKLYICGIDVDDADPGTQFVKDIMKAFPKAYIEGSPSGKGFHIILLVDIARIPQENGKLAAKYYSKNPNNGVETYVAGLTNRYFTFTEDTIQDGEDVDQTDEFLKFLDDYMLRNAPVSSGQEKINEIPTANTEKAQSILSDDEIIAKARNAANGAKFTALFDGDISGYESPSNADMGLMNMLAFYTRCDKAQMERLFSRSALGQRNKWQNRWDYRNMTIDKAIADCRFIYEPHQKSAAHKDFTLKPGDYSDVGQAEVLAREYGGNLRYSEATDFISYNGTYWEESKPKAQGLAQELTKRQLDEARAEVRAAVTKLERLGAAELTGKTRKQAEAVISSNPALSAAYNEWAEAAAYSSYVVKERESKQIKSALREVQPMVLIDVAQLDADPFLLNTPGSTYDLRRGMDGTKPHDPSDYITRCTAVSPSDVGTELWSKFLLDVFCNDLELIDYVQRINGICAVGKVFIEQIVISHGDGRNGKSSFWNSIIKAFGSYSGFISSEALTANCRHNVRPEIAELRGKRAVLARELQEGKRLDESILKKITSTDPVDGEKKYKSPFSFTPTHTTLMYTNFLPKIGSRDAGTKRRLCVVPFAAKFEGKSDVKNYGDFLYENAGGAIMKWVIEGAKKVIDSNFRIEPPECVRQATKEYIDAFDWLSKFLDARCRIDDSEQAKSGELYTAYRVHCDDINEPYKRSAQDFNAALISAGFERIQPGGEKKPAYFKGLRLLTDAERDFEDEFISIPPCDGEFVRSHREGRKT